MVHPDEFKGPEADALPDTATLPAELAALYLCMSPAQLADLRKSKRPDGRAGNGASIIKPVESGAAAGPKDAVLYKLGILRDFAKSHTAPTAFDTALDSGLPGWVSAKLPFFAEREPRVKRAAACSSAAPGTGRTPCARNASPTWRRAASASRH